MKKLILIVSLVSVGCFYESLSVNASDVYSTNSVRVDLTGWEEPEAEPPKKPEPPTGVEVIKPQGVEGDSQLPSSKLPQTGERDTRVFTVIGSNLVIIALSALIYKRKHIKGEF